MFNYEYINDLSVCTIVDLAMYIQLVKYTYYDYT